MAASVEVLGDLHSELARELTEQVKGYDEETEDGKVRRVRASPAVLGVIATFLKHNSISADPTENEDLVALNKALASRRRNKTPMSQAALDAAAEAYSASHGGVPLQ